MLSANAAFHREFSKTVGSSLIRVPKRMIVVCILLITFDIYFEIKCYSHFIVPQPHFSSGNLHRCLPQSHSIKYEYLVIV